MEIPSRNMAFTTPSHTLMCAVPAAGNCTKLTAKKNFSLLPLVSLLSISASFREELATPWTEAEQPWKTFLFFPATQHHHGTNSHVNPFVLLFICKPRMTCKTTVTAECALQTRKVSAFQFSSSCSFKSCLFPTVCCS